MSETLKCVAVPNKECKNELLRKSCKAEKIPLCIIAEPAVQVLDNGVLKAGSVDDVRLHKGGFKIRVLEKVNSHFLVEALENHGEIKKGDKFLTLKLHCERLVKEPTK